MTQRTRGIVYTWGEDERLARAVLSILARADLEWKAFESWLDLLASPADGLWDGDLDPERYMAVQNARFPRSR